MIERIELAKSCWRCKGSGITQFAAGRSEDQNIVYVNGGCDVCHGTGFGRLPAEHLEALLVVAWNEVDSLKAQLLTATGCLQDLRLEIEILRRSELIRMNSLDHEKDMEEKHAFAEASEIAASHPVDAVIHRVDPVVAPRTTPEFLPASRVDPEFAKELAGGLEITKETIEKAFEHNPTLIQLWMRRHDG